MRIAALGPEGTFSHEVALRFNTNAKTVFADTIRDVFGIVSNKKADFGIVPVENSIGGSVGQTLDCLIKYNLIIKAEEIIRIAHNLVGFGKISDIKYLYLHQQTYEQCESFIKKILPNVEVIMTSSNGKSAEIITKYKDKSRASIVPIIAARIYRLKVLKKNVQDSKFNTTRFFAVGKNGNKKTGRDRTSIAIDPQIDRPGLLHDMIGEFAKRGINLTKIESRPSKGKLGRYVFYIDFEGHITDRIVAAAIKYLGISAKVKILGSYPRKY